jgi:hypothetical protein
MSSPATSQSVKPTEVPPSQVQSQDLVATLPAPVLRLLVLFAWPISLLRRAIEVVCWKSGRRVDSWMVVGAWWAVCLGASHAFRYVELEMWLIKGIYCLLCYLRLWCPCHPCTCPAKWFSRLRTAYKRLQRPRHFSSPCPTCTPYTRSYLPRPFLPSRPSMTGSRNSGHSAYLAD